MNSEQVAAVDRHLRELSASPLFERAPLQAKALAAMVGAAVDGQDISGAELADAVYGRADDGYVRAVRQLARELRLKLPSAYEAGRPHPVRFELHPNHYAVRIIASPATPDADKPESFRTTPAPRVHVLQRLRWPAAVALAAAIPLGALAVLTWPSREPARLSEPHRIEVIKDELVFSDATGRRLSGWWERLEEVSGFRFDNDPHGWGLKAWVQAALLEGPEPRVAAASCNPLVPGRCALHLLSARGGQEIDRFELPRLPEGVARDGRLHETDGETFVPDWSVTSTAAGDFDGDGLRDEVLVSLRLGRLFPSQTLVFDYEGGWTVLADYWNMGAAQALVLEDLDGDKRDEILVWGENNSYQRGFLTILSSAGEFPVGGRSPDGYRVARLAEVQHYPYAGITLQFPFSDLETDKRGRALRNPVTGVEWDASERVLHVTVQDVGLNPDTRTAWQVSFRLEFGPAPSSAFILEHDSALAEFRRLIAQGQRQDRWNIEATERLTDYGRDLASRILVWDAREPSPTWRPLRAGELGQVFPGAIANAEGGATARLAP